MDVTSVNVGWTTSRMRLSLPWLTDFTKIVYSENWEKREKLNEKL